MNTAVTTVTTDPDPCEATGCVAQAEPVVSCWRRSYPFTWNRQSREDQERRELADAREKDAAREAEG